MTTSNQFADASPNRLRVCRNATPSEDERPAHIISTRLPGRSVDDLAHLGIDWVRGTGVFEDEAAQRRALGLPTDIPFDRLRGGCDITGQRDHCLVRTRTTADLWTMAVRYQDPRDERTTWRWFLSAKDNDGEVVWRHLIAHSTRGTRTLRSRSVGSSLTRHMASMSMLEVAGAQTLAPTDVGGWVRDVLANPDRTQPLVLISPANRCERPLLDSDALSEHLHGAAAVYVLADVESSWVLTDALGPAGLGEDFGCFNGAVRVYQIAPKHGQSYTHRFLRSRVVDAWARDGDLERLAGALVESLWPPSLVDEILWELERTVAREFVLNARPRIVAAPLPPPAEVAPAPTPDDTPPADRRAFEELLDEAQQQTDTMREELEHTRSQVIDAEGERDRVARRLAKAEEVTDAVDAVRLAQRVVGDRLVITDDAMRSARRCKFEDVHLLLRALVVTGMFRSDPDFRAIFKRSFGNRVRWKPRDSVETMAKFGEQRMFKNADGERRQYTEHLTLGHTENERRCAQVYLALRPEGVVEVVYAGKHLPIVSVDT